MLSGDLSTMALADVLQWVDAGRGRALVTVTRPDGQARWLLAEERVVIAAAAPPVSGRLSSDGTPGAPGPALEAVALEYLLDLFLQSEGKFELRNDAPTPPDAVRVSMPVQFLVMEGLRLLDERTRLEATYPRDEARLAATDADAEGLSVIDSAIVQVAQGAPALGEVRLVLGLSRPSLLRHVDSLRQRGLVDVEGTAHGPDIEGSVIQQAQVLLRERQYAEAAHVFRSLLATNPEDGRVRRLLQEAERLQIDAAYELFSPTDVVTRDEDYRELDLKGTDRAVLDCLERPRSVAILVLVSPLRELETLSALRRLASKGLVTIEAAD